MKNIKKSSIFKPLQFMAVVLTLIFAGCCPHAETYKVPEDFKQYFYFPEGSWWVYENQSGLIDTLTIQSVSSEIEKMQAEDCNKFERLSVKFHSTQSYDMEANIVCHAENIFYFCFSNPDKSFYNNITNMPILAGNEHRIFACTSEVDWSIVDSLLVGGIKYSNVYFNQSINVSQSYDTYPVNCYFAKNIGLIKRELQNGEIWELVDYKINR